MFKRISNSLNTAPGISRPISTTLVFAPAPRPGPPPLTGNRRRLRAVRPLVPTANTAPVSRMFTQTAKLEIRFLSAQLEKQTNIDKTVQQALGLLGATPGTGRPAAGRGRAPHAGGGARRTAAGFKSASRKASSAHNELATIHAHRTGEFVLTGFRRCQRDVPGPAHGQVGAHIEVVE